MDFFWSPGTPEHVNFDFGFPDFTDFRFPDFRFRISGFPISGFPISDDFRISDLILDFCIFLQNLLLDGPCASRLDVDHTSTAYLGVLLVLYIISVYIRLMSLFFSYNVTISSSYEITAEVR